MVLMTKEEDEEVILGLRVDQKEGRNIVPRLGDKIISTVLAVTALLSRAVVRANDEVQECQLICSRGQTTSLRPLCLSMKTTSNNLGRQGPRQCCTDLHKDCFNNKRKY